jgi:carboxyl-terminal processing protease
VQRKKNLVSLNEAARRKERDADEARLKSRESRNAAGKSANDDEFAPGKGGALLDDGLRADERNLANQLAAEKVRKNAKDVLLNEAVQILGDQAGLLQSGARLAVRVKPGSRSMPD